MDDRTIPHACFPIPVRFCEVSRLQVQLLAQAYLRLCPENRRRLGGTPAEAQRHEKNPRHSTAARAAEGA